MTRSPEALEPSIAELKAEFFKTIGHPARIRILETLVDRERSVGEIQPLVGIESSHLSQQLGILRRAGIVSSRREGSLVFYSVRDPQIAKLLALAKQMLVTALAEKSDLLYALRRPDEP